MSFAVGVARGHPGFDVNHGSVFRPQIAGAALHDPVGQLQPLQHLFAVGQNLLMPADGFVPVVAADNDLLNLVKLVDTVKTGGIFTIRAGLAPKWSKKNAFLPAPVKCL